MQENFIQKELNKKKSIIKIIFSKEKFISELLEYNINSNGKNFGDDTDNLNEIIARNDEEYNSFNIIDKK